MKYLAKIFITVFIIILAMPEEALSIPAFARKYRLSCLTCHAPAPRLKAYGNDFAGNGFQLTDQKAPRYFVETGDDELDLIREFPLAVRLDGHLTYNTANSESAEFGLPYLVKLMSGGAITEDVAYYFYFYLSERGEVAGVEDAYIMFNDLFGIDFDIYLGQFQISDPLFKRELRLTLEDYELYKARPGISKAALTYDRGIMATLGFDFGLGITVEAVNGAGLIEAGPSHLFDTDDKKMYLGRVSQDIGDFLRIGAFTYAGSEVLNSDNGPAITNEIMYWGPDATIAFGDILELNLQYLQRTDSEVYLTGQDAAPAEDIETKGALGELVFLPHGDNSVWYGAALFNWVESGDERLNYKSAGAHFGYLLRRNIRLVAEGLYNFSDENEDYVRISAGFVTGF